MMTEILSSSFCRAFDMDLVKLSSEWELLFIFTDMAFCRFGT
jgi:hypothetical protein